MCLGSISRSHQCARIDQRWIVGRLEVEDESKRTMRTRDLNEGRYLFVEHVEWLGARGAGDDHLEVSTHRQCVLLLQSRFVFVGLSELRASGGASRDDHSFKA